LTDFLLSGSSKLLEQQLLLSAQPLLASQHMVLALKLDLSLHEVHLKDNSKAQQNHAEHSPKTWAKTLR